jgi:hypothetical protein
VAALSLSFSADVWADRAHPTVRSCMRNHWCTLTGLSVFSISATSAIAKSLIRDVDHNFSSIARPSGVEAEGERDEDDREESELAEICCLTILKELWLRVSSPSKVFFVFAPAARKSKICTRVTG